MIVTVAIPSPLRRIFDYLPPLATKGAKELAPLKPGVRVRVPFGGREVVGIVIGHKATSDHAPHRLRPVTAVLDMEPLVGETLLRLYRWCAHYYQHPIGDALLSTLPVLLRQGELAPTGSREHWQLTREGHGLAETSLSRAKKQRQLVQLLRERGPLTTQEIVAAGIGRPILKAVRDRGLVATVMISKHEADTPPAPLLAEPALTLRREQQQALSSMRFDGFHCYLLFGDTGSGKTEIYLQAIEKVLESGRQALVLVPEIGLTPQTLQRFRHRFNCEISALHSALSDRERLKGWADAREGRARIVIGTRSAVFTPLKNPGIVVLDEEHDLSFKQQDGFRYSARDVAVMRASKENIPIILGSATPSLESLHNCQRGRYQRLDLRQAQTGNSKPEWRMIDLRGTKLRGGFSTPLIEEIDWELKQGHQVLVFLNRRGYAPIMLCHDCGWMADCPHCSTRMTAHLGWRRLVCHHCEARQALPDRCPQCHSHELQFIGQGTERSEEVLGQLFPATTILRIDRDTTRRKNAMARVIGEINKNAPCILLGTQMLAKGHHFPGVSLAALLDVDGGLFSPDFRATERMAQQVTQVAGRAGRGDVSGRVFIQTYHAEHPLLAHLARADYRQLAQWLLEERRATQTPPFVHLALIRAEALEPSLALDFLHQARKVAEQLMPSSTSIRYLGPLPAAMEKRNRYYRFVFSIYADRRTHLSQLLKALCKDLETHQLARKVRWAIDVDPQEAF